MDIWQSSRWKNFISFPHRRGLRLIFDRTVDIEVRTACKEFAKWLRSNYVFPLRVNIYIKDREFIRAKDGDLVYGTFFRPCDFGAEPYIKIAVGDYDLCKLEVGRDNALASILNCMAHELTHYYQYINCLELTLRGEEIQATFYAKKIVYRYAETRDHP